MASWPLKNRTPQEIADKAKRQRAKMEEHIVFAREEADRRDEYDRLSLDALRLYGPLVGAPDDKINKVRDGLHVAIGKKHTRQLLIHAAFRIFRCNGEISVDLIVAAVRVCNDYDLWVWAPTIDLSSANRLRDMFRDAFERAVLNGR